MKTPKYEKMIPTGKCKKCGINFWEIHDNGPAPKSMPCPIQGCEENAKHHHAKVLTFDRSSTGSPIALITG